MRLIRAQLLEAGEGLAEVLDQIEAGRLSAPAPTVHRLEGALLAVRLMAAGRPITVEELQGH